MTEPDPYAHLPVMQRPGYIYKETKHIVARNIRPGDEVRQSERIKGGSWVVEQVEVTDVLVYVWYHGRKRRMALARPSERIWIDRPEGEPLP